MAVPFTIGMIMFLRYARYLKYASVFDELDSLRRALIITGGGTSGTEYLEKWGNISLTGLVIAILSLVIFLILFFVISRLKQNEYNENRYKKEPAEEDDEENSATNSTAAEIRVYKTLLDDGIITQEEFNAKKKELLNL